MYNLQVYDNYYCLVILIKSILGLETGCQFFSSGPPHSLLVLWWDLCMSGD